MDSISTLSLELSKDDNSPKRLKHYYLGDEIDFMDSVLVNDYEMETEQIEINLNKIAPNCNVEQTFIALVSTIVETTDDDELMAFCCECLIRWPNLSCLPLKLNFDVIKTLLEHTSTLAKTALAQLLIYCDDLKLEFLSELNTFLENDVYLTVGLLKDMEFCGQLYEGMFPTILNKLLNFIFELNDGDLQKVLTDYVSFHSEYLQLDKSTVADLLKDDEKREVWLEIMSFMQFEDNNKLLEGFLEVLLDIGDPDCIKTSGEMASSDSTFCLSEYFHTYFDRLVNSNHTHEVMRALNSLWIEEHTLRKLAARYGICYALIPFIDSLDSIDDREYVTQCLESDTWRTLTAINQAKLSHFAPLVVKYVGQYEEANAIVLKKLRNSVFAKKYANIIVTNCLKAIEMDFSFQILEKVINFVDVSKYSNELWLALENLRPFYERTVLMLQLCAFEEFKQKAYEHYNGWVMHFLELANSDKQLHLIENLPISLFNQALIHLTEVPGGVDVNKLVTLKTQLKCDRLLADYSLDSNDYDGLWQVASVYKSRYAQRLAWRGPIPPSAYSYAHSLFSLGLLEVPSDEDANRFIRATLSLSGAGWTDDMAWNFAEVVAYLYNNTNVPLHIELLKRTVYYGFPAAFMCCLVEKLDQRIEKRDLLPILVSVLLNEDTEWYDDVIEAIKVVNEDEIYAIELCALEDY